jgi:hypothetical protein
MIAWSGCYHGCDGLNTLNASDRTKVPVVLPQRVTPSLTARVEALPSVMGEHFTLLIRKN